MDNRQSKPSQLPKDRAFWVLTSKGVEIVDLSEVNPQSYWRELLRPHPAKKIAPPQV